MRNVKPGQNLGGWSAPALVCGSLFVLTLLPALAPAQAGGKLPSADKVIAMAIESYGGEKALRAVKTIKGVVKVGGKGDSPMKGKVTWYWASDGRSHQVQEFEGMGKMLSGCDGKILWEDSPAPRILEGDEKATVQRLSRLFPFLDWKKHYTKAENLGEKKVGYYQCYEIKLSAKTGKPEFHYIDKDTGTHVRWKLTWPTPDGEMATTVDFSSWKRVGDLNLPHAERREFGGMKLEATVTTLEINKTLPTGILALPESIKKLMKK